MPSPRNQLGQSLTSKPDGSEMMGGHCQRTLAAWRMDACLESEAVNCKHKAKVCIKTSSNNA
ncbi:hypothetical protein DPMN_053877 [Dreissena polymorpha]|uniref:Uncharacterized protein n=1 Tax=Dreissena polymorpha TaxID=45954 RepID=A0A9D4HR38_DREPO|nr:hypothetical protein DPMN_053877 [Dreissena polymorpha]